VNAVAASNTPTWGDGPPDLFASTGNDVLGSDDALAFASLPGLPDLSTQAWPALAWTGLPDRALMIAGAEEVGFFDSTPSWLPGSTGLNGVTAAFAPGSQSVAYLLGIDGRIVRTLSAGRDPAAVSLTKSRIVVGGTTRLTAAVRVAAPGTAVVRSRVPGRAWATLRRVPWTTADWDRRMSFDLSPSLSHEYLVEFEYGGTTVRLTPTTRVVVEPRVATARSRYVLRVGDVFRFSGTVTPRLEGERVELYTDRGGSWRPVSLQRSVALRDGRSWRSRMFGTPTAETYHLRARVPAARAHAGAWSRVVTVTIR
jgi:hypothetical protein